ncbi:MAG: SH3 domain-containing protein [Paenirhodobacter sp.]|uniref:SH3 domain-containing protein n=1 Tax=Paenirhodobacter sp. TaxID=1965326 RepID=UPI003D0D12BD
MKASVSQGYQNVRSGPGTMYPVLFAIPARSGGIRMIACQRPDAGGGRYDWCQIEWKGQTGWSSVNGFEPEF